MRSRGEGSGERTKLATTIDTLVLFLALSARPRLVAENILALTLGITMPLTVASPATWCLPPELTKAVLSFLPTHPENFKERYGHICSSLLVCKDWKVSSGELFSEALSGC
jgi:hypothetical protein